ncbi:MAG: hypothetical protein ACLU4N_01835 [Butyricimonas faecihominis]
MAKSRDVKPFKGYASKTKISSRFVMDDNVFQFKVQALSIGYTLIS